jgi:hypothetical protein
MFYNKEMSIDDLECFGSLLKNNKCIVLNSNIGSGKSKTTVGILENKFSDKRVLMISPSVRLTKKIHVDMLKSLPNMEYYQEVKGNINTNQLVITPNSLHRLKDYDYDIVVIDESLSVVKILSNLSIYHRHQFRSVLENSEHVIMLDADNSSDIMRNTINLIDRDFTYVNNEFVRENDIKGCVVKFGNNVHDKKGFVFNEINRRIRRNEKLIITTATKTTAEQLEKVLSKLNPTLNIQIYTGNDNMDKFKDEFTKELENINETWLKYDVIIHNSVIPSGISVEIEDRFNTVGIFDVNMGSPLPINFIQQLGRNRCMKSLTIYDLSSQYAKTDDREELLKELNERIDWVKNKCVYEDCGEKFIITDKKVDLKIYGNALHFEVMLDRNNQLNKPLDYIFDYLKRYEIDYEVRLVDKDVEKIKVKGDKQELVKCLELPERAKDVNRFHLAIERLKDFCEGDNMMFNIEYLKSNIIRRNQKFQDKLNEVKEGNLKSMIENEDVLKEVLKQNKNRFIKKVSKLLEECSYEKFDKYINGKDDKIKELFRCFKDVLDDYDEFERRIVGLSSSCWDLYTLGNHQGEESYYENRIEALVNDVDEGGEVNFHNVNMIERLNLLKMIDWLRSNFEGQEVNYEMFGRMRETFGYSKDSSFIRLLKYIGYEGSYKSLSRLVQKLKENDEHEMSIFRGRFMISMNYVNIGEQIKFLYEMFECHEEMVNDYESDDEEYEELDNI